MGQVETKACAEAQTQLARLVYPRAVENSQRREF
jgi:hypothetical protein